MVSSADQVGEQSTVRGTGSNIGLSPLFCGRVRSVSYHSGATGQRPLCVFFIHILSEDACFKERADLQYQINDDNR